MDSTINTIRTSGHLQPRSTEGISGWKIAKGLGDPCYADSTGFLLRASQGDKIWSVGDGECDQISREENFP